PRRVHTPWARTGPRNPLKETRMKTRLLLLFVTALLVSQQAMASQKSKNRDKEPPTPPAPLAKSLTPSESLSSTRFVNYSQRDVGRLNLRLRYTTLIVLPKEEVILDYVTGDKELWVIEGEQNFAYVKPTKEGAETNLNLVTASGNVYSFMLGEVSGAKTMPD